MQEASNSGFNMARALALARTWKSNSAKGNDTTIGTLSWIMVNDGKSISGEPGYAAYIKHQIGFNLLALNLQNDGMASLAMIIASNVLNPDQLESDEERRAIQRAAQHIAQHAVDPSVAAHAWTGAAVIPGHNGARIRAALRAMKLDYGILFDTDVLEGDDIDDSQKCLAWSKIALIYAASPTVALGAERARPGTLARFAASLMRNNETETALLCAALTPHGGLEAPANNLLDKWINYGAPDEVIPECRTAMRILLRIESAGLLEPNISRAIGHVRARLFADEIAS